MFLRLLLRRLLTLICALGACVAAQALTTEQARALVAGEADTRVIALNAAVLNADAKTIVLIQAISDDAVKFTDTAVFVMKDGKGYDPVSGAELPVPESAEDVLNPNVLRGELDQALAAIKLLSTDEKSRADAVKMLLTGDADEAKLPLIDKAYAAETVPAIKDALARIRAKLLLASADKAKRLDAALALGASGSPAVKALLIEQLKVETEPEVKAQIESALKTLQGRLAWGERIGVIFTGVSLGSILLLVALGLGVLNKLLEGLAGAAGARCTAAPTRRSSRCSPTSRPRA